MGVIEACFRLETPALAGEADPRRGASIRVPGLLGAMRRVFWLLAPTAVACRGENDRFEEQRAQKVIGELLGAAASEAHGRQGAQGQFLFSLPSGDPAGQFDAIDSVLSQLAGPILRQRRPGSSGGNNAAFHHVPAGATFRLRLRQRSGDDQGDQHQQQMLDLLKAFGLIGGVGAATRRGFGSLTMTELTVGGESQTLPGNAEAYEAACLALVEKDAAFKDTEPQYSGLWSGNGVHAAIYVRHDVNRANAAVSALANDVISYARGWQKYSPDTVFSHQADHDWKLSLSAPPNAKRAPSPVLFHVREHQDHTSTVTSILAPIGSSSKDDALTERALDFLHDGAFGFRQLWPEEGA